MPPPLTVCHDPSLCQTRASESNHTCSHFQGRPTRGTYNPSEMFVISTSWMGMADGWWVEAGYGYGIFQCGPRTSATWYTARWNSSGYLEACPALAGPGVGTTHAVDIVHLSPTSSTSWLVSYSGVMAYGWNAMKTSGNQIDVGLEANHWATAMSNAWSHTQQRLTSTGTWQSWTPATSSVEPPAYGSFVYGIWLHGIN